MYVHAYMYSCLSKHVAYRFCWSYCFGWIIKTRLKLLVSFWPAETRRVNHSPTWKSQRENHHPKLLLDSKKKCSGLYSCSKSNSFWDDTILLPQKLIACHRKTKEEEDDAFLLKWFPFLGGHVNFSRCLYHPRTQMTTVLIGKGLVLEGFFAPK